MPENRDVIFEFIPMESYIKVTAMDTITLIEVSVQCPAGSSEHVMRHHALKRLDYVMRKKGI